MKELVKLKSYSNSITLIIDESADFDEIKEEITGKFAKAAPFFKDASIGLAFEGRELNEKEQEEIVDIIHSTTRLKIVCLLVDRSLVSNEKLNTVLKKITKEEIYPTFLSRNILTGENIDVKGDLTIYGNVYEGASISAGGNVLVFGSLCGTVVAGLCNNNAVISALEMRPESAFIGETEYIPENKNSLFKKKSKIEPSTLTKSGGKIICEVIKEL